VSGTGTPVSWLSQPPRAGRIVAYLGMALLGAVVGTAGSLVQAAWFPGGLLLALLAAAGLFYGSRCALGTQLSVAASAGGWLTAIVLLSSGQPEGDALFGAGLGPIVFMLGGTAAAVICATMFRFPQPDGGTGRLDG
jgi:hypothetical protein